MKQVLLTLAVIGTFIFSSCEKEELTVPKSTKQTLTLKESALLCNCGGGSWDINDPEAQVSSLRNASYDGESDTISAPATPAKLKRLK